MAWGGGTIPAAPHNFSIFKDYSRTWCFVKDLSRPKPTMIYLINPLNRSSSNELTHFLKWMKSEHVTFHLQYKHSGTFANLAWVSGLPMGEGGGGEGKGRPDTKPFSKSCDTSKIWMWQWLDNTQYPLTSPTARAIGKETVIEIFHRCFDFMLPVCDTFMDRDAERNSKRL